MVKFLRIFDPAYFVWAIHVVGLGFYLPGSFAHAKINVLTSQTDLQAIAEEVGGELVFVQSLGKGTQDLHSLEAKPSFMVKAHRADLFLLIGLDLEQGWAPQIIHGARNSKIKAGQRGYLEIGPLLDPLEIQKGEVSRAQGDVHPFGNPHVWLDPVRVGKAALLVAQRLAELDPKNATNYLQRAKAFQARLDNKLKDWTVRIQATGIQQVITYHKTLSYFLQRFKIQAPLVLEPKPGIPPTSRHILEVIETMKGKKISLILVENFFDPSVTKKIRQEIPTVRTATVAVSVGGAPNIRSLDDLFEHLVLSLEGK